MKSQPISQDTSAFGRMGVMAFTFMLTLQLMRVFFTTVVNTYGERVGLLNAAPVALGIFLAPLLIVLLSRWLPARWLLYGTVIVLALARGVAQVVDSPDAVLIAGALGTAVGLMALPILLAWERGLQQDLARAAYRFVLALIMGMALDAALQGLFRTWDAVWQRGLIPLLLALVLISVVSALLWVTRGSWDKAPLEPSLRSGFAGVLLGPYIAAQIVFLNNVGFATTFGLSIAAATGLVLIGNALALIQLNASVNLKQPRTTQLLYGVLAFSFIVLMPNRTDWLGMLMFVLAHSVVTAIVYGALCQGNVEGAQASLWRSGVIMSIGSVLLVLPPIVYFAGQTIALPFPAELAVSAIGVLLGLAIFVRPSMRSASIYKLPVLMALPIVLLLIVMGASLVGGRQAETQAAGDSLRVVNYNLHYGVNTDGKLDPEGLARTIEAEQPDVITLQEISRGWLISGSVDLLEWLAVRLDMPYVAFAPAADRQFGNGILSRIPLDSVRYEALPTEGIPQKRSYMVATLAVGDKTLTIINTHLSAWVEAEAHLPQVEMILKAWNSTPYTIITGDMNSVPGAPDIQLYLDAGFQSAQDEVGDPTALTASSKNPDVRIDWIFGTQDVTFSDFVIPQSQASDHFPVATTIQLN